MIWIVAIGLSLVVAGALAYTVLNGRVGDESPAAYDLRVYRDQLKDVDRDVARGVISAEDAERVRAEVSRRILAADADLQKENNGLKSGGGPGAIAVIAIVVMVIGGSVGLYSVLGAPGYGDLPLQKRLSLAKERHDSRPSQKEVEAQIAITPNTAPAPNPDHVALVEKLRETIKTRPNELEGYALLAQNEAVLGRFTQAHQAQGEVLRIKAANATSEDFTRHAELMISAAQGFVSPEAENALRMALQLDQNNQAARYFWGLMRLQNDRPDLTLRIWDQLLKEGPENAPWVPGIRQNIDEIAWRAGQRYEQPAPALAAPALAGPTAEDIENAKDMSEEDRTAMIQNMVDQLGERLATQGGTPAEWARLIGAHGVLGNTTQARAIWEEAQMRFADKPEALAPIRQAAERAGVAP